MSFNNQSIDIFAHDYETTGLNVAELGVLQAALCIGVLHQDGSYELSDIDTTLLNPGEPISAEATAIHGYTDFDVADKQPWEPYLREQMATVNSMNLDAVVSFNGNRFDNRIAQRVGFKPLRSLDLAKAAQALKKAKGWEKYNLAYTYEKLMGKPLDKAHDAFADVQATLDLIKPAMALAGCATLDEFAIWMRGDAGSPDQKISFGKHKGSKLKNLPSDYVKWLLTQDDIDPDLREGLEKCQ